MNKQQRILWSLLIQCPLFAGAEEDCPLAQYRNAMSLEESFQFVEQSTPTMVKLFLGLHHQCFQQRQETA